MAMKNESSLARRKRSLLKSGWLSRGRPLIASMPKIAQNAEKSTASSNMMGVNCSQAQKGLPAITSGYASALVHHWSSSAVSRPVQAPQMTSQPTFERGMPIASLRSWTGKGQYASHFL